MQDQEILQFFGENMAAKEKSSVAAPSPRTRVRSHSERGVYDREVINLIVDEAIVCHVGFVDDGQPFVIPQIHVRLGDYLYLHGAPTSRLLKVLASGGAACVSITLVDGLVLARSAFHHSMNYRSVVVLGQAEEVLDELEKAKVLTALVEHVVPGRGVEARPGVSSEVAATMVVKIPLTEASAKIRTGPPVDQEQDYALSVWAGVIPLKLEAGEPVPDPQQPEGLAVPAYVSGYARV